MMDIHYFLGNVLHNFPIVQLVQIIVVGISLPPVLILLTRISKIALHDNCKFLLIAWNSAFLVCLCVHCVYICCDFVTGIYIPENNHDPPVRLLLFAIQGFFHAMSSAQELMLSIERAVSSASPEQYHTRRLSKRALFLAEFLSVVIAMLYSWIISKSANPNYVALSCCLINTVDITSIICLSITTRYISKIRKFMVNSSLNNKYQIIEALKVAQVMLPCGVISIVMKISSSLAAWTYAFNLFDSKYMFTITGGAYFIIESLNCMLCTTYVLWNHDGLRRSTLDLFRFKNDLPIRDQRSIENAQDLYFDALRKEWH